jgi:hypothetical protein
MNSLYQFTEIMNEMNKIKTNISALQSIYTNVEARNSADEALIDLFVSQASDLEAAATALKGITFGG